MFSVFPEFQTLTINDREAYESLVKDYPAASDLSFTTLMLWWNLDKNVEVSLLNDNLVLHYRLPNDEQNSGYAIIGEHMLRESFIELFEYLEARNLPVRSVHVPEFVSSRIVDLDDFTIEPEPDYDEYVLDAQTFSLLEGSQLSRVRRKVAQFAREAGPDTHFEEIDIADPEKQAWLLATLSEFYNGGQSRNDPDGLELRVIEKAVQNATVLKMHAVALYVNGQPHGLALYQVTHDNKYVIVNHVKVLEEYPHAFDVMLQHIAHQALVLGVSRLNIEMDLGIPGLRFHKQGLRPVEFHRKFTISPAHALVAN